MWANDMYKVNKFNNHRAICQWVDNMEYTHKVNTSLHLHKTLSRNASLIYAFYIPYTTMYAHTIIKYDYKWPVQLLTLFMFLILYWAHNLIYSYIDG